MARAKTPGEQTAATGRLSKAREAQEEFLKTGAETLKIKEVQDRIKAPLADIEKKIEEANAPIKVEQQNVAALDADLTKFVSGIRDAVKAHGADTVERAELGTEDAAAIYGHRRWQTGWGIIGTPENDPVAIATKKKFRKKGGAVGSITDFLKAAEDSGGGGGKSGGGGDGGEKK